MHHCFVTAYQQAREATNSIKGGNNNQRNGKQHSDGGTDMTSTCPRGLCVYSPCSTPVAVVAMAFFSVCCLLGC